MLSFAKMKYLKKKIYQIYGVMPGFVKNMELYQVFAKIMEIC